MPLANSWKELSPSPLNGWCGWWNLNRSKLQIFERENWGKPCFSWMRIERFSVHYWGNQRCSMVCLRPSKEHCQFLQEILALELQYSTKVEKTRLTWSKKQPFGLVKGRIFPDSFCTCCSCYNWIPWAKMTRDCLVLRTVTANAKAEIQKKMVCSCNHAIM